MAWINELCTGYEDEKMTPEHKDKLVIYMKGQKIR